MPEYDRDVALGIMRHSLHNTTIIFAEAKATKLALPAACALMQKESGGRNVYGHDAGGMLSGFPDSVNKENFAAFWWMVKEHSAQSNGVGPCQITSQGLLQQMMDQGLNPWVIAHNMHFGFDLLRRYYLAARLAGEVRPWVVAGARFNGAVIYGEDLAKKIADWREALTDAEIHD